MDLKIDLTKKSYVIDSNVIEDDPEALVVLSNGADNNIIILYTVLAELDNNSKNSYQATEALKILKSFKGKNIFYLPIPKWFNNKITHEAKIKEYNDLIKGLRYTPENGHNITFVSTNSTFLLKALACGVQSDIYKNSNPYLGDSQRYAGVYKEGTVPNDLVYVNGFEWRAANSPPYVFHTKKNEIERVPQMNLWGVTPLNNYQNMAMYLMMHPDIPLVTLQSCAGLGKAQPLYSKILTPSGWSTMGSIKVGDAVISDNGKKSTVIGTFPQGKKEIYRVHFNDRTYTDCCKEHLWDVRKEHYKYKTVELQSIMNDLYNEKRKRWNYFIPIVNPIEFEEQQIELDPYILGVLIGDGCLTQGVTFTSADNEIVNNVKELLPDECTIGNISDEITFSIIMSNHKTSGKKGIITHPIKKYLIALDLMYKKSEDKFIPDCYKFNSIENRIKLLQGLMDTDGSVAKFKKGGGYVQYYTKSSRLKDDVESLIRSLGGKAKTIRHKSSYSDENGDTIECGDFYTIQINLPKEIEVFKLSRKKKIYETVKQYPPSKCIINIELLGEMEAQCIMVDSKSQLYVTDDFIVTHNTYLALAAAFALMLDPAYKDRGHTKIFITKPTIEIGESLGYLPGSKEEKMAPYVRSILDLVFKLHELRGVSKIFKKIKSSDRTALDHSDNEDVINKHEFKTSKFEVLPINYIRGMNIDNAIVIIDEPQNLTRGEMRTLLSRMGQNVKCFCIGDTSQVDHGSLDEGNNGLNWTVRLFRGEKNYGHLVLKGQQSRGPITDMVIKSKL